MTPDAYLDAQLEPARSDMRALDALIRRCAPDLPRVFTRSMGADMVGYGPFHYRYASGREGDATRIALAAHKTGISLYLLACDEGGYVAEQAGKRLGKAKVGKSCIRFKRLADLNLDVVEEVLRKVASMPGMGETTPTSPLPPRTAH